jgi:DNA-binding CsgD family transcriptional regulator
MATRLGPLGRSVARRLRLLGWAYALALLSLAALGLSALVLVGLPMLALSPVGPWLLLATVRLVRRFADAHRWIVGSTLHNGQRLGHGAVAFEPAGLRLLRSEATGAVEVPSAYPPWPRGGRWRQLRTLAGEPATWRDLRWLVVTGPVGLVTAFVVGVLPNAFLHYAWLPLQYPLARPAEPGIPGLWTADSQTMSLIAAPVGLAGLLLWWRTAPLVLRGYALLSRRLLGPAATTALTARILELIALPAAPVNPVAATPSQRARLQTLTTRERQVLALVAEGRTNAAIAARLYISEKAVDKHINSVFRKLELDRSTQDNRRVLATLAYLRR